MRLLDGRATRPHQELRELLGPRTARQPRTDLRRERSSRSSRPARQRSTSSPSAPAIPSTSSGAATMPAPVSRRSAAASPSGGHGGEDRALGGQVLEHLAREDALSPPVRLRNEQQERVRVALEGKRLAVREVRDELEPIASRPRPAANTRSRSRKSPTNRATTAASDRASASRNGRGSRRPKKLPVCVIRKRSDRRYSSPVEARRSRSRCRSR